MDSPSPLYININNEKNKDLCYFFSLSHSSHSFIHAFDIEIINHIGWGSGDEENMKDEEKEPFYFTNETWFSCTYCLLFFKPLILIVPKYRILKIGNS